MKNLLGWIGYGLVAAVAAYAFGLLAALLPLAMGADQNVNVIGYGVAGLAFVGLMLTRRVDSGLIAGGAFRLAMLSLIFG